MTKRIVRAIFTVITVALIIAIGIFSLYLNLPGVPAPLDFNIAHFAAYSFLALCGLIAVKEKLAKNYWLFVLFAMAYGTAIEYIQPYVGRFYSVMDLMSNIAGIILVCFVMSIYYMQVKRG